MGGVCGIIYLSEGKGDSAVSERYAFDALCERGVHVFEYDTIGSTNTQAREYAQNGGSAPALFVAREQTDGRGRMGRSFFSPMDTGLYMTLLLDVTDDAPTSVVRITTCAAVAVSDAIEQVCGKQTKIKWVNDLYLAAKKVCGILAESFCADGKRYVIIGVGVNLCTERFPAELDGIAASLGICGADDLRTTLAVEITERMIEIYDRARAGDITYIGEYKRRSAVLGKEVVFSSGELCGSGVAESIDADGSLHVRLSDGTEVVLNSGEISLRIKREDTDQ